MAVEASQRSRRAAWWRARVAIALLTLGTMVAACGDDDDDDDDAAATAPPPTAAAAGATATTASPVVPDTANTPLPTETSLATAAPASPTSAEATATAPASAAFEPCEAAELASIIQTPVPMTPTPAPPTPVNPTPAPPTATPGPAPTEDRVGFPENYAQDFKLMYVMDRVDNSQVRIICGNDLAVATEEGEPFAYGSALVMETWRTKRDASGAVIKDENGRFIRESLSGIFVMRKEEGFGEAYQEQRSGEWEYVAYRPDGEFLTPPERTNPCAACHVQATEAQDWVFRLDMFYHPDTAFEPPEIAENEINVWDYQFLPATFEVAAGTGVTWVNNDEIEHTVTEANQLFDSGVFGAGETFTFTFDTPGTYEYVCTIHRGMSATVNVTE
jgi:plastocyanin